jgi:hypothetical protein
MKARNAGTPQPAPWPTTIRGDAKRQRRYISDFYWTELAPKPFGHAISLGAAAMSEHKDPRRTDDMKKTPLVAQRLRLLQEMFEAPDVALHSEWHSAWELLPPVGPTS